MENDITTRKEVTFQMQITIIEDTGQKVGAHNIKHKYWEDNGIELVRAPLPAGDYIIGNEMTDDLFARKGKREIDLKKLDFAGTYANVVDTKKDIAELISNICGKQHARFRDECIWASNNNVNLTILIENRDGVKNTTDLFTWQNPRLNIWKNTSEVIGWCKNGNPRYKKTRKYPSATNGQTLAKACMTMEKKYGVHFLFCTPEESGRRVIEILSEK